MYSTSSHENTHLVEEQDEVDCEGDKQSQQTHIIKIPCKEILVKKGKKCLSIQIEVPVSVYLFYLFP